MDQQTAEKVLADLVARWDVEDDVKKLGREFVVRLDLTCERSAGAFTLQVIKLVNRQLNDREGEILAILYNILCSGGGPESSSGPKWQSFRSGNLDIGVLQPSPEGRGGNTGDRKGESGLPPARQF